MSISKRTVKQTKVCSNDIIQTLLKKIKHKKIAEIKVSAIFIK